MNDVKLIRQNCGLYASFFPGGFVPVVVTCAVKLPTAELNLALKQRMHYRVTATSDVTYKMRDHAGTPLLSGSGAGVALREWPTLPTDVSRKNLFVHGIGIRMVGNGTLRWEAEVRDAHGAVLMVVKDCTYTNATGTTTRLDLVHIIIVGAE